MKKLLKKSIGYSLLPLAFVCFQYNQMHGYFAERYDILFPLACIILMINALLSLLRANYSFITSCWIVLFLPSFSSNFSIDILIKLIILILCIIIIKKLSFKFLNFVFCLILCFNAFQVFQRDLSARKTQNSILKTPSNNVKNIFGTRGNIYWILCDAYTSFSILKEYYDFDNSHFYNQLEALGFTFSDGKLSYNEVNNFPTLKALNWYLNFNTLDVTKENALTLHFCLKNNLFFKNLKQNGYSICAVHSRFPFLHKIDAESIGTNKISTVGQFIYHCFKQNQYLGNAISEELNKQLFKHQESIFHFLENKFIKNNDPTFYYIHLDTPHAPFVRTNLNDFNNDQKSKIWGENEVSSNAYTTENYREQYISQLQGLSKKIIKILENIISKDPSATIILQGDHGTFTTDNLSEQQCFLFALRSNKTFSILNPEQFFKQLVYGEE